MSFKFPFNLQSLQEQIGKVDLELIQKLILSVNPGKAVSEYLEQLKELFQPLTAKTQTFIQGQVAPVEPSELPEDYLNLEKNCDLLLKLYTDLLTTANETYATVGYDYPPANLALAKFKDANVGLRLQAKFAQLKNVLTPQEMERILLGKAEAPAVSATSADSTASLAAAPTADQALTQVTSPDIAKTLYGHLGEVALRHSAEFQGLSDPLALALTHLGSVYHEIGAARLTQDHKIMAEVHGEILNVLNDKFLKVNELRKRVYAARHAFDLVRLQTEDEENEELIASEDDLVAATEQAVDEMSKLISPAKNINLLKVLVKAQQQYFEFSAKRLSAVLTDLDKIEIPEED